jgi:excisionase family DNA binding protein
MNDDRIWHSTATAASLVGAHPSTVLKALEAGELHGAQRVKKGRWRIHRDCLAAWALGEKCDHQKTEAVAS